MAKNRYTLSRELHDILGSNNIYYNPPESQKMNFPCIVYNRTYINDIKADNIKYLDYTTYKIIVISKSPDHPAIKKILQIPMTRLSANYVKDGFYHDVITLIQKEVQTNG